MRFKRPALQRRILRRMALCKCETLPDYITYISRSWEEVAILQNEFLVGVTSFFRDPDAWEALEEVVLPQLFRDGASGGRQVKTWCAACSTGEEAYRLALACHDFRMRHGLEHDFRIYATDLKTASLEEAKRGIYPNAALSEIPPRYLRPELLIAKGSTFEIDPLRRRQVVFSRRDMVKDQPFPQFDLIVCRNALIYYNQETQKLLLDRFSGALRPGGVLFLGAPEVSTAHASAFRPMRGTSRFLENTREERVDETESAVLLPHSVREKPMQGPRLSLTRQDGVASLVMAEMPDILRHLGAAVFVLNEEDEIQRTFGDYERFIEVPRSRTFTSNLLDLLPDPLSVNVALLMRKAAAAGKARMPAMDPGKHLPSRQVEGLCHITSSSDDQTTYIITLNDLRTGPAHSLSGLDADASTGGHDTMDDVLLKAEIASLHDKLAETVQDLQDIYAERQVMEARLLVAETELAKHRKLCAAGPERAKTADHIHVFVEIARLADVGVRPGGVAFDHVALGRRTRQDDHEDTAQTGIVAHGLQQVEAGQPGQAKIEDDEHPVLARDFGHVA